MQHESRHRRIGTRWPPPAPLLAVAAVVAGGLLGGAADAAPGPRPAMSWDRPIMMHQVAASAARPCLRLGRILSSQEGSRVAGIWWDASPHVHDSGTSVQAASSADSGRSWVIAQDLSPAGVAAGSPDLVTSDDGSRLTAVWVQQDSADPRLRVYAASSTDAGATWGSAVAVSPLGALYPRVAASADGTRVTAVWWGPTGSIQAAASVDGGLTWSPPSTIAVGAEQQPVGFPLTLSHDGARATVAWTDYDSRQTQLLRVASSGDGGVTWSTPRTLTPTERMADQPQLVASADGTRVAAAWLMRAANPKGNGWPVYLARSVDAGASWSSPRVLSGSAGGEPVALTMSDEGNRLSAAWSWVARGTQRMQATSSRDGGASWTPATSISPAGRDAFNPTLTASADGRRVTAVWGFGSWDNWSDDLAITSLRSAVSTDGAATWGPMTTVSSSSRTQSIGPTQLAATGDGQQITASWGQCPYRTAHVPSQIVAARSHLTTATAVRVIAKPGADQRALRIRVRPDLGADRQWRVRIRVLDQRGVEWSTMRRLRTQGPKHAVTATLGTGRYVVEVPPGHGYLGASSEQIRLKAR